MNKLQNKTVIITGAASGIGSSIVDVFAEEGATIVLVDLQSSSIREKTVLITQNGGHALAITCDISDEKDVEKMMESVMHHFGGVDIVVNNAGIMDDFIPTAELTTDKWNRVLGVNLNGPFYVSRAALRSMLPNKKGVILNIDSVGGLHGGRAGAAYTTAKHGLIGLTKNTAFMYANEGIRCNAIAPGGVETAIGLTLHPHPFGYGKISPGLNLMPRAGKPIEIARLALFLVTDDASFINGSVVTADAGWTAF